MDKTMNKLIIGFIILVVFDSTSFTVQKNKFGLLGSVVSVVKTVKNTVAVFNWALTNTNQ